MAGSQPAYTIRSVAIIGAGPSGLTAAKYLKAEQCFDEIVIFERQPAPGGIWNYVEGANNGIPKDDQPNAHGQGELGTPLYRDLECNAPAEMMEFSDLPLPPDLPLFPPRSAIQEYLNNYAQDITPMIKFNSEVSEASPVLESGKKVWQVSIKDLKTTQIERHKYDAIIVASGRQAIPRYPQLPGVQDWLDQHPGTITHSAQFDTPDPFSDKKALLIGNSTSGLDISRRLAAAENPPSDPIYVSQRSKSTYHTPPPSNVQELAATVSLVAITRTAHFSDGTSRENIDRIIFCTGYFLSYSFLGKLSPAASTRCPPRNDGIVEVQEAFGTEKPADSGAIAQHLYEYIFPYDPTSSLCPGDDGFPYNSPPIAFVNTLDKIIFFKMMESQSAVIAGVFSGRLSLPRIAEMNEWEAKEREVKGGVTYAWNTLRYPNDVYYFDRLHDWAAGEAKSKDNAQNVSEDEKSDRRKLPKKWGDREKWLRTQVPNLRKAYMERGNERHKIRTIEELGFFYDAN